MKSNLLEPPQADRGLEPGQRDRFLKEGAIFSLSRDQVVLGIGPATPAHSPQPDRLSIYAPDFLLNAPRPWLNFQEFACLSTSQAIELLDSQPDQLQHQANSTEDQNSTGLDWSLPNKAQFQQDFEKIKALIRLGGLSKAVPVASGTSLQTPTKAIKLNALQSCLMQASSHPVHAYGFWNANEGIIGVTPEVLFELRPDGSAQTMALAGTRRKDETGNLLSDAKELHEHQVVVDGIVERLHELAKCTVGQPKELQLTTLVHLCSSIEASPLHAARFEDWVSALHPTPAIGAWPREEGVKWVRQYEGSRSRRRHGAPFGISLNSQGVQKCLVAIRCLQWDSKGSQITAGSGIVAESQFEKEWMEILSKIDAVQSTFGL